MSVSAAEYRAGMRQLAAAVNVITTAKGGERAGLTATAVMSLTAEPPQLGIALNKTASAYPLFMDAGRFAVNVLSFDQVDVADRFAGQEGVRGEARFEGAAWTELSTGAPILEGTVAAFDCEVASTVDLGTHTLFVGLVRGTRVAPGAQPLLYLDGLWASLVRASQEDIGRVLATVDLSIDAVDRARHEKDEADDRLRAFVELFTAVNIRQSDVTREFFAQELYARPAQLAEVNGRKSAFDAKLQALLEDGVRDGSFAIDDPRLASLAIVGMISWVHRWYRQGGRLAPDQVADGLAQLVLSMVSAPRDGTEPKRGLQAAS